MQSCMFSLSLKTFCLQNKPLYFQILFCLFLVIMKYLHTREDGVVEFKIVIRHLEVRCVDLENMGNGKSVEHFRGFHSGIKEIH